MTDFDEQWESLMDKKYFKQYLPELNMKSTLSSRRYVSAWLRKFRGLMHHNVTQFDYHPKLVKEFLKLIGEGKAYLIKNSICLDAGAGPGRWTYAMMQLGAERVDSFDISEEAIKRCRKINDNTFIKDIFELTPSHEYDFVLSWGVLHHTANPRLAFSKVASQVKKGGTFHVMIYNKENDSFYEGFRGDKCLENHEKWINLTFDEKIKMCEQKAKKYGGSIHGWFDALNPKYNWSFEIEEIRKWFIEEGFSNIKLQTAQPNINMNGIL